MSVLAEELRRPAGARGVCEVTLGVLAHQARPGERAALVPVQLPVSRDSGPE